jgi:hypothetical protein
MTTSTRFAFALSLTTLIAACSDGPLHHSSSIGAAGGSVSTASGITLRVPAGAVSRETEIRLVETEPGSGKMARVRVEPAGLALGASATLTFKVDDGNVKLAEVEHGPEGEVRHELEKRRRTGEVEVELSRLSEVEMEHGLTCSAECGAGFECDDGVCKPHVEDDPATHDVGDDNGMDDPATHDLGDDNGVDPAPAPAPGPAPAPVDDKGNHGPGHP